MSDITKAKYTFMVYAPDYTDPETYSRRMAVRQQHLDNAKSLKLQGVMRAHAGLMTSNVIARLTTLPGIGGGLLAPETHQTADKKLIGSMLVFEMESLEDVRKLVESDVYWTSNVVRTQLYHLITYLIYARISGTRRRRLSCRGFLLNRFLHTLSSHWRWFYYTPGRCFTSTCAFM